MNSPGNVRRSENGMRRVTILGSTGSIGQSTVDLLMRNPEGFEVEALTAYRNPQRLAEQARALRARFAAIANPSHYSALKEALTGSGIQAACGVPRSAPDDPVRVRCSGLAPGVRASWHGRLAR